MKLLGECFILLPPITNANKVLIGHNTVADKEDATIDVAQEVIYYDHDNSSEIRCDGGATPEVVGALRLILQTAVPRAWGGNYGANEKDVVVALSYCDNEPSVGSGHVLATDIVRYTLAAATSASDAVDQIGTLVGAHAAEGSKANFVVCDGQEAWIVSCWGKYMAAAQISEGSCKYIAAGELLVRDKIDKSSVNLAEDLKAQGLWNGETPLDFASLSGNANVSGSAASWPTDVQEPAADAAAAKSYTVSEMFSILRQAAVSSVNVERVTRSSSVSMLNTARISTHFFTATPFPQDSVFKPFVFSPKPVISTLTQTYRDGPAETRLHEMHRKGCSDVLKNLEERCVQELEDYISMCDTPSRELDELMKDCVEAEVKFYR